MAFSRNSVLNPIISALPKSSPPPRYARFMLSTKVHPALFSPGTNHRRRKGPQARTLASGVHTELKTRPSCQANPAAAWPPVFKCLIISMLPSYSHVMYKTHPAEISTT